PWSAQVPALADPGRRAYVAEIAALMDARTDRIGEHAASHPPCWETVPLGPEPATAAPDVRAAWHQALAALGPADGPDVRGMPDGRLLHLRDTYPTETAWAPRYVGDELRQVRGAAWDARLAGLRSAAEAHAAEHRGDDDHAAARQ